MFIDSSFLTEEELLNDNSLNEALEDLNQMSDLCFDYQNYLAENGIIYVQLEGRAYLNEDHYLLSELNAGFVKKIKDGIKLFLSKFKKFIPIICGKIRETARRIANAIRGKFSQFTAWLKKVKITNGKKTVSESFDDYNVFNGLIVSERKPILYKSQRHGGTEASHSEVMGRKDVTQFLDLGEFEAVQTNYMELWKVLREANPELIKVDNIDQLEEILIAADSALKLKRKNGTANPKQVILDTVKNIAKIETDTKKAEADVTKAVDKAEKKVDSEATKTSSPSSNDKDGDDEKKSSGDGFFSTIGKYIGKFFGFIKEIFMSIINGIRGAWRAIVGFFKGDKKEESPESGSGSGEGNKTNKEEKASSNTEENKGTESTETKESPKEETKTVKDTSSEKKK